MGDSHNHYENMLLDYAADSLSGDERAVVEAHLADCETCRALLAEWHGLAEAVRIQANVEAATLPPLRLPILPVEITRELKYQQEYQAMTTTVYPNGNHIAGANPRIRPMRGHTQMPPYNLTAAAAWIAVIIFVAALIFGGQNPNTMVATQTDEPLRTVYETLVADGRFSLMVELIDRNGWVSDILNGDESVTLFAVTDADLQPVLDTIAVYQPGADISGLLLWGQMLNGGKWSIEWLTTVARRSTTFTILEGKWTRGGDQMKTGFAVMLDADDQLVVGHSEDPSVRAHILEGDIAASNGLIHVIDTPLIARDLIRPPAIYLEENTLAEIIRREPEFSGFYNAFERSAWAQDVLAGPSFVTLLLPTNAAVQDWLEGRQFADLSRIEVDQFMMAHLLRGQWSTDLLVEAGTVRSTWEIEGNTYSWRMSAELEPATGRLQIKARANVTEANNIASNGVYHVIDAVLYDE